MILNRCVLSSSFRSQLRKPHYFHKVQPDDAVNLFPIRDISPAWKVGDRFSQRGSSNAAKTADIFRSIALGDEELTVGIKLLWGSNWVTGRECFLKVKSEIRYGWLMLKVREI